MESLELRMFSIGSDKTQLLFKSVSARVKTSLLDNPLFEKSNTAIVVSHIARLKNNIEKIIVFTFKVSENPLSFFSVIRISFLFSFWVQKVSLGLVSYITPHYLI